MTWQELLPPELWKAPVEEQLVYLLARKETIERLLVSLERYRERQEVRMPRQGPGMAC